MNIEKRIIIIIIVHHILINDMEAVSSKFRNLVILIGLFKQ